MTQFYQLTLDKAIAKYEAGLMSSVGLLYDYFCIKFKAGWRISADPDKICQQLKLTKDQFYRGFRKIKEAFPHFKIDIVRTGIKLDGYIEENTSTVGETPSTAAETPTGDGETPTDYEKSATYYEKTADPDRENPSKTRKPSVAPDSSSDDDQSSFNSLSDREREKTKKSTKETYREFWANLPVDEREKFLAFVEEKTKHFSNPIVSKHDYLASDRRWEEFYKNFRAVVQVEENNTRDWTKHPHWSKAVEVMRYKGMATFRIDGIEGVELEKPIRLAMSQFVRDNEIWKEWR
ncbi:MAG: hypothetical protein QNJ54_06610 [Prochloraceae cyanobacterium]|nr:hypothetical protein [Prochloraceae cyanobacterium]